MSDERQKMSQMQQSILNSLSNCSYTPAGFDQAEITRAAATLIHKRAAVAARCHPALAKILCRDFHAKFQVFASQHNLNSKADCMLDSYIFAIYLIASNNSANKTRLAVMRYLALRSLFSFKQFFLCLEAVGRYVANKFSGVSKDFKVNH